MIIKEVKRFKATFSGHDWNTETIIPQLKQLHPNWENIAITNLRLGYDGQHKQTLVGFEVEIPC